MGLFRTFIFMRMRGVRSLREMTRLLDTDLRLRRLCLIKPGEKGYTRSVLSRFIVKVGETRLIKIIEEKVVTLLKQNDAKEVDSIFDASFIKAWSTRDPLDSQTGYFQTGKPELDGQAEPSDSATSYTYQSIQRLCFL
jgi:hypothetical protein